MNRCFNQLKFTFSIFYRTAFFLLLSVIFAHAETLPIKNYTAADGLGSSFISSLIRDSRGFLWFATRDGLSRFDGSQFTTYQVGERNAPPGIEQIIETKKGIYWIATTGGLYRFDPNVPPPKQQNNSARPVLNAEFVSERRGLFYEDNDEKLWFLSNENLNILEEKDGKFVFNRVALDLPKNTSVVFGIKDFRQTRDGSFWIVTTWGAVRRLPDGRDIFYSTEAAPNDSLNSVLEDRAGRIWLARSSGIYIFNPETPKNLTQLGSLTVFHLDEIAAPQTAVRFPEKSGETVKLTAIEGYGNGTTPLLFESVDGLIWISTAEGIVEFDGEKFRAFDSSQGTIAGSNAQLVEDLDGNLWIGGLKGLSRLDRRGLTTFGTADGFKNPNILVIGETADNQIYTASNDYFIGVFDGKKFELTRPPLPVEARGLWTSSLAFLDSRNDWWFLSVQKAYRFAATDDFAGLARQKPIAEYDSRNGLTGNQAYRIYEDRNGDLWISTRDTTGSNDLQPGLAKWNRAAESFQTFTEKENFPARKSASAFVEDAHGNLWIGFYEGGLVRYSSGRFTAMTNDLPPGLITGLHADKKGRLWMTTALSGVSYIEDLTAETPKFVYYKTENGLASNNARSITEDDFGRIYVGTARGVDRITPETGQIKHYTTNDGLAGDFVQAAFRSKDGALWFGTPNGLSRLVPQKDLKSNPPPVWISGLRIAGESQTISQLGVREIADLELAPEQNNLQIDYFGIEFKASEALRYQYQLEGADGDWSQPTEQRTVNYANLSPGNYRFLVRAMTADGTLSENSSVVSFKVARPVWQRWWFLILAAAAIGFLIYSVYRYRVAQLLKLERVRTRIATDLHDDIGSSLSQIAILSEVVRQKIGDGSGVNEPLKMIAGTSREMVDSMSDIVWAINPDKDHLSDLIQRMRRFASDVLETQDIAYRFYLDEKHRDLALGADIRREVYLIFKESVNNLVKYAAATEVEMSVLIENNFLVVKVKDNGKGFSVPESFVSENDFTSEKIDAGFGGNGLINMRRRAENLGGRFKVESKINGGTSVEFRIPTR